MRHHQKQADFLDCLLKSELQKMADPFPRQVDLTDAILAGIQETEQRKKGISYGDKNKKKEYMHMKRRKLLVAGLVAALCLTGATCFAFGKIGGYSSHSYRVGGDFPTQEKVESILSAQVDTIENFSNGFHFTDYSVGSGHSYDENGHVMETLPQVVFEYRNAANEWIMLDIYPVFSGQEFSETDTIIPYDNEISFRYNKDHYKFVPLNYEISPEEQTQMDAGELFLSYGSDSVDDCYMSNLSWVKDGIYYSFVGKDLSLDQDQLVEMAKELVAQNK